MAHKKLTKEQEDSIVKQHQTGVPATQIAFNIGCSTRTVGRVLTAKGIVGKHASVRDQARGFLRVLGAYEITTPKQLHRILQERADGQARLDLRAQQELSMETVQQYLNACRPEQLASLFYTAGLIKIAEMHNGSVMNATLQFQKEAQKGKVQYGQPVQPYKPFKQN